MSADATIVMLLIGSFVWGGFFLILLAAVRKERGKAAPAPAGRGDADAADAGTG